MSLYCQNTVKLFLKYCTNISEILFKYCSNIFQIFSEYIIINNVPILSKGMTIYCPNITRNIVEKIIQIFSRYWANIDKTLSIHYQNIGKIMPACILDTVQIFPKYWTNIVKILSRYCPVISQILTEFCMDNARLFLKNCPNIIIV